MTFFVYFDLIIKNNIASFLVVLIIGKVVYLMKCGYDEVYFHDMQFLHLIMIHKYDTEQ